MREREKTRLFVALDLGEGIGEELCELTAPVLAGGVRTYPPRDLHLTLHFIGAVPSGEVRGIEAALDGEVAELAAPRLVIDSTGCFPPRGGPRIWWAGVSEREGEGRFDAVFRAVERALVPVEARSEEWIPHLTLGRTARRGGEGIGARKERFLGLCPALEWDPDAVVLVESRPDRPEARYRAVATWPFRGGAGPD